MADLTQTVANVRRQITTQRGSGTAGESISAGMPIYRLSTDNKWYKAGNGSATLADAGGIALTNADVDEILDYAISGGINVGATLTLAEIYVLSDTVGKIAPASDLGSGDFVTILGVASSTSQLELNLNSSGVAKP